MESGSNTVIVIGAGISGLVAARTITRASPSTRVIVLESSDRVGGRTLAASSTLLPAVGVDAGGQWIGARQRAAQNLLRELEIRLVPQCEEMRRVGLSDSPSRSTCRRQTARASGSSRSEIVSRRTRALSLPFLFASSSTPRCLEDWWALARNSHHQSPHPRLRSSR